MHNRAAIGMVEHRELWHWHTIFLYHTSQPLIIALSISYLQTNVHIEIRASTFC